METKIPPPVVTLIFIFFIVFSNRFVEPFSFMYQLPVGIVIIICGLLVLISAVRVFKHLETTINPLQIIFGAKLTIFIIALFVLYITFFQIMPEERAMNEKFTDWKNYSSKVRRWL